MSRMLLNVFIECGCNPKAMYRLMKNMAMAVTFRKCKQDSIKG